MLTKWERVNDGDFSPHGGLLKWKEIILFSYVSNSTFMCKGLILFHSQLPPTSQIAGSNAFLKCSIYVMCWYDQDIMTTTGH